MHSIACKGTVVIQLLGQILHGELWLVDVWQERGILFRNVGGLMCLALGNWHGCWQELVLGLVRLSRDHRDLGVILACCLQAGIFVV